MLSQAHALHTALIHFLILRKVLKPSLIIASDLSDEEFNLIWQQSKSEFESNHPNSVAASNEVVYNTKTSAQSLFAFLHNNITSTILFNQEEATSLLKSSPTLNVLQGAVCSSPDSGQKWSVEYLNNKAFIFKGSIIMHVKTGSINWKLPKYHYLLRDNLVIKNLNEHSQKLYKII